MRRGIANSLGIILFALLLFSIALQVRVLPHEVGLIATTFPEVEPLVVPSIVWGVIAIACWQAIAVIALRLIALARHPGSDHERGGSARGWVRAIVGCLVAFLALVVSAFIALSVMGYTTPGVMLGLIGAGIIALIALVRLVIYLGMKTVVRPYSPA